MEDFEDRDRFLTFQHRKEDINDIMVQWEITYDYERWPENMIRVFNQSIRDV